MIKYKEGYKYQLYETYAIKTGIEGFSCKTDFLHLFSDGTLVIYKGYAWDGATGFPDIPKLMPTFAVHDALYRMIREGLLPKKFKKKADETLIFMAKGIMERDECNEAEKDIILGLLEHGVEWFGNLALNPDEEIK